MASNEGLFRDIVIKKGLCDRIQLGQATEKSKVNHCSLADNLVTLGYLSGEQIAECYSSMGGQQGIPPLAYSRTPERYDIDVLGAGCFQENEFMKRQFIPLILDGASVIFMVNPFDDQLVQYIRKKYPMDFKMGAISADKLELILNTHYSSLNIITSSGSPIQNRLDEITQTDTDIATNFFKIIRDAVRERASDIHFVPSDTDATVTMRIDGDINIVETTTRAVLQRYVVKLLEFTTVGDTNDKVPRTGKALIDLKDGTVVNLRVSLIPGKFGPDVNVRIITDTAIKISNLGYTDPQLEDYRHILSLSKGLILIVGPTGSGKSTSLYGGLSLIKSKKIMSIEDPVEYVVPGMLQVDVSEEQRIGFGTAIKAFMRHDPDVIVVGEIRDLEVANSAIVAANTGHLVISTLHTNSAVTAANRLITMGVDRYSICEELSCVMAQRLIKRVCPHCKTSYTVPADSPWIEQYKVKPGSEVYKGTGCAACRQTGYLGRVAVIEILRITKDIRNGIETLEPTASIEKLAVANGFVSMLADARNKALQGITTFEQVDRLRFDLE